MKPLRRFALGKRFYGFIGAGFQRRHVLAGPSRARVTARFSQLRDAYDDFDVRQTTVNVAPEEYERASAEFDGVARADVRVRNDAGEVLAVRAGSGWREPGTAIGATDPIAETAREAVHEATGVSPALDGLDRVAIVCFTDDDPGHDPAYRLHVRFLATAAAGTPGNGAAWRPEPPENDWL